MVDFILKADEMMAELHRERGRVLVEIQEKRGLLSVVRKLPSKILLQIFRETLEFPFALDH
ncbi:uncharacterized protein BT62DRAFT_928616 [Guyanagaster necrorhizus]|uniref:Uncharacterized protein n=1 Tax=Guyanagaster necrorhizus TaxID=856835 RepID=A0A9P7W1W7_9AGAR|nr:uncharacterized protein BT62DRAFT_928616 [Guyanagaster necrorhizus MCA 3950]KAG7449861.1 hypothetical protein BT62DRAFT_928616 [Guyanagaster necrorhizus MCA 3950]